MCMASVRAVVPGQLEEDQYFASLEEALSRYPADRRELVVGTAEAVDVEGKTVTVAVAGAGEPRTLAYDQLVVATGARATAPGEAATAGAMGPWKGAGTYEEDVAALRTVQDKVRTAKRIVVAGGGSTGVEVAGELGYEYGSGSGDDKKEVILLASGDALMGGDATVAGPALSELQKLQVDVRLRSAVTASRLLADGRTELTVAGTAEPLVADVYLTAFGLTPNTEFLADRLLDGDGSGRVVVDDFYRVVGVASQDVWAVGDAVSRPRAGFMITQKQAAGVARNVALALRDKPPAVVKLLPVDVLAVATGRGRGTGRIGSVRMPSLMVWLAKGRTLGTQYVGSYTNGSIA